MSFRFLQISQKTNEIFSKISTLASKRGQIKIVIEESQNKILQFVL